MSFSCEDFHEEVAGAREAWSEELASVDPPKSNALESRLSTEARTHLEKCTDCRQHLSSIFDETEES